MRPSSSPSERPSPPGLFDGVLARGAVRPRSADDAWVRRAARRRGRAGPGPGRGRRDARPRRPSAIVAACAATDVDIADLSGAAAAQRQPGRAAGASACGPRAAGDVAAARAQRSDQPGHRSTPRPCWSPAGRWPRCWPTCDGAADAAAALARDHRDTAMAGRTLLQQAVPTTFGLKAAGWLVGARRAPPAGSARSRDAWPVQLGGAAGTLAGLGAAGPGAWLADFAAELGPGGAGPAVAHRRAAGSAELAGALGAAAGVARQGRPRRHPAGPERGRRGAPRARPGGSSAMAAQAQPGRRGRAPAAPRRRPGWSATLLAAWRRSTSGRAGGWHAEWRPLRELLVTTGSAAAWLRDCLDRPGRARRMRCAPTSTGPVGRPNAAPPTLSAAPATSSISRWPATASWRTDG